MYRVLRKAEKHLERKNKKQTFTDTTLDNFFQVRAEREEIASFNSANLDIDQDVEETMNEILNDMSILQKETDCPEPNIHADAKASASSEGTISTNITEYDSDPALWSSTIPYECILQKTNLNKIWNI
ncbi:hypothetical protein JTE90_001702 [Oedothorax gibbosus]|uniref:Uncharacterized protein n=1 Tax=Oedothorax gibbosus TaxID=931172 RepID=A0AAV6TM29_9ARAC|nr:hypothetical protein JTE90_001702 [Oedothorax gibbosus]